MSLSSLSKPTSLIVSAFLFSAIACPAPCAMIRLEAKTPRSFGLAVSEVRHDVDAGRGLAVGDLVGEFA